MGTQKNTAFTHSKTRAKQLLNEAGYPEGFAMDIWAMPVQRAYNPNALTMAKLIQADLNEVGIKVDIVSYEWSTFLRRLRLGEHSSVLLGWSADHPDPDNFLPRYLVVLRQALAATEQRGAMRNMTVCFN